MAIICLTERKAKITKEQNQLSMVLLILTHSVLHSIGEIDEKKSDSESIIKHIVFFGMHIPTN